MYVGFLLDIDWYSIQINEPFIILGFSHLSVSSTFKFPPTSAAGKQVRHFGFFGMFSISNSLCVLGRDSSSPSASLITNSATFLVP